ncbi:MAG: adenosylcobinamide amidohydrolase [Candidatus Bathyarchaeota archaeon]|nr:adenosylcobinamide amidohydrolase [Candidatus Bathyarchaeota archaeon]
MKNADTIVREQKLNIHLDGVEAKVIWHKYDGVPLNTTLVSFGQNRRVLSTIDGLKHVPYIGNVYVPGELSSSHMTLQSYAKFQKRLPATLGIRRADLTFVSTAVNMEKVAVCEKSYGDFKVCIIATGGAKNNALRMGVDRGDWVETKTEFQSAQGTINMLLLTNVTLSVGAMARAIMTATEGKTAALEDLHYKSTPSPKLQATGTGTDSMIVASANNPGLKIYHTGGHTKMGELIGFCAKEAVTLALRRFDNDEPGEIS